MRVSTVGSAVLAAALLGTAVGCSDDGTPSRDVALRGIAKYLLCREGGFDAYALGGILSSAESLLSLPAYSADVGSLLRCYASAGRCTDVTACMQCNGELSYCDGNTAVGCMYGLEYRRSCSAVGQACFAFSDYSGSSAGCSPGACSPASDRYACSGSNVFVCVPDEELWSSTDCRGRGVADPVCMPNANPLRGASCVSRPLVACDPSALMSRCDGDTAVRCDEAGYEVRQQCGQLAWRTSCTMDADYGGARCRLSRTACGPYDSRCVGNVAQLCVEGIPVEIDCGAMGAACRSSGSDTYCEM